MNESVRDEQPKSWLEIFGYQADGQSYKRQVVEATDDADLEWWYFVRAKEFLGYYNHDYMRRPLKP